MNTNEPEKIKMILKFDTGADGFLRMIYVLAIAALLTLIFGIYFLLNTWSRMHNTP